AKWRLNRSLFGIRIDHDLACIPDRDLASQSITVWHASDQGLASCRSLRELTLSYTVSIADFYANGGIDVQKEKSQEFHGNLFQDPSAQVRPEADQPLYRADAENQCLDGF
ncbi:hypothetical protein, partial [Serratia fonticola]|uniref:hypothetical protein n=1 Tax=Serratia fonticola TaxID=47917 RepID=UPI001F1E6417